MKLYLRKQKCEVSEQIKQKMIDQLWQLVKVEYTSSTLPFLQTDDNQIIQEPEKIIEYLLKEAKITPSVWKQISTASAAAKKVYKKLLKGEKIKANQDLIDSRIKICNDCKYLISTIGMRRCSSCGCFLKAKITLETEKCPEGKW